MTYAEYKLACAAAHKVPLTEDYFAGDEDDFFHGDGELVCEEACCCHCGDYLGEQIDARHPEAANYYHESCEKKAVTRREMDELESAVEALAEEHDWETSGWDCGRPGSWYVTLSRECDSCILGGDEACSCETIKVRIADHGTAYCTEDFSIITPSGNASGDDHTLEILAKRLARIRPGRASNN